MQVFKKFLAAVLAFALIVACAPAVALPAQAATTKTQLWSLDDVTAGTTAGSNTSKKAERDDVEGVVTAGKGMIDSSSNRTNALEYKVTAIASTASANSQADTLTISSFTGLNFNTTATVSATDDILWFWLDSDLVSDERLQLEVNGYNLYAKSGYIYTIEADADGNAQMVQITPESSADDTDVRQGVALMPHSSWTRIKIQDGWSGWLGLPLNFFSNASSGSIAAGTTITKLGIIMGWRSAVDANSTNALRETGSIYFDEFWLTSAGTMPNLTNDQLLYDGDAAVDSTPFALNSRYQNGMIFQQKEDWIVHGTGPVGSTVTVKLLNGSTEVETKTATVGSDNSWSVTMSPVNGSYTYYQVSAACGSTTKTVKNVAFGEVWVTGGQSNMYYRISETDATDMFGSKADVAALQTYLTDNPNAAAAIRMYYHESTPTPTDAELTDVLGVWHTAENWDSVYGTSAVAMHYAKKLQAELDIPVGVVVAARGGTSIGTWVDADVAKSYADFIKLATALGYPNSSSAQYKLYGYYNAHVAPWQGFNVAGLLWYQGENDRFHPMMQELGFEVMVESFSRTFTTDYADSGLMDVIAMQVAPFVGYTDDNDVHADPNLLTNSALNAAMRAGAAKVQAKGGKAVLIPIYDLDAIVDDHHPLNKEDVAKRILQVAMETYYDDVSGNEIYSGPVPTAWEVAEGVVTITFDQEIRVIPLTAENNQRITKNNTYQLPADTELYTDTLNGFSVWSGQGYVSADAQIVGTNQVQVTLPSGVTEFAGIAYAYGLETLSANLYDADGLPALPFLLENEDYTHRTQLWSTDEVEAVVIVEENVYTGTNPRNTSKISIAESVGFAGTQGLKYELVTSGNDRTNTWNSSDIGQYGFRTDVTIVSNDDILWFWASANYSTIQRLQLAVNGQTIFTSEDSYIYTLGCGNDGNPVLIKIPYGGNDPVDGVSLLKHSATQSQIQIMPDWSGWIGIPVSMIDASVAVKGEPITSIGVLLLQKAADGDAYEDQKNGDNIVLDEFWLTSAGCYPDLKNMVPLQANIWNVEDADLTEGKDLALAGSNTGRDTVSTPVAVGEGVGDSKALANVFTSADKSNSNNVSLTPDKLGNYGYTATPIQDSTNVLWFWVDSDLPDDRLLHLQLNGNTNYLGPNYIYTIINVDGVPTRQTVSYDPEGLLSGDGLALVASAGKGGAAESNYARIRLDAGWSGWIGVPVENFSGVGGNTAIPTGNISNITFRLVGGINEEILNETVYFDEFWLTAADLLPNLSNDQLLYVSDGARQISLQNHEDLTVGTPFDTGNSNYGAVSSTVFDTKGVLGSNSMSYFIEDGSINNSQNLSLTGDNFNTHTVKRSDILWFWINSDLSNERLIHVQVNGNTMAQEAIYTIAENAAGEPEIVTVDYVANNTEATSMAPVNYLWNNGEGTYARIKVPSGWSGWVGVPVSSFGITDGSITSMVIRAYANAKLAPINNSESIYFDEFWLTSPGVMPNLSKEALLYKDRAELKYNSASLVIEDGISVNFKADASMFTTGGYTKPYAVFTLNDMTTTVTDYTVVNGKYVFCLYNIRPDWIGDEISATLYAYNDGKLYQSPAVTYSVAQYCYNKLSDNYPSGTAEDALATLLVDILRYGEATQIYTDHKTDDLVTADLIGTPWENWGTASDRSLSNVVAVTNDVQSPAVVWKKVALFLRETSRIRFQIATTLTEDMTLKGFVNGQQILSVSSEDFIATADGYYVFIDGLSALDMSLSMDYAVFVGEEQVSKTLTYSVESYAANAVTANQNAKLVSMMKAMIRYGDSAKAYRAANPALPKDTSYEFLFIGNSYTYYNEMPADIFAQIAAAAGYQVNATRITKGGQKLSFHADVTSETGIQVQAALTGTTKYDYVILQEQSVLPADDDGRGEFYDSVRNLLARVRAAGAQPVLYNTWGRKTGHSTLATYGWTNETMTWRLAAAYTAIGEELDIDVAYAGLAMFDVYTQGGIELYNEDLTHPSYAGSYLAAMTIFAEIFRVDPTTIDYNGTLDASVAAVLKQAAKDAVFNTPEIPAEYITASEGVTG